MTGLERLIAAPEPYFGARVGLLTNPTGVTRHLNAGTLALLRAGIRLERLFAPEHGIDGSGAPGEAPEREREAVSGLEVFTTYRRSPAEIAQALQGLDVLFFDLQDVGCRFYTYLSTLAHAIEATQHANVRLIVLDRPNPLGFEIEGPILQPGLESFVGIASLPLRHGLTLGEAGRFFARHWDNFDVFPCDPNERFSATSLPWVPPSPNLPNLETALLYPGMGLVEALDWSEGRGTASPFKLIGAPGVNANELTARLNSLELVGVRFRPAFFTPTTSKHAGTLCNGVQVHLVGASPQRLETVHLGLSVLTVALEFGAQLNLEWLHKLLGQAIAATELTVDNISNLINHWKTETQAWAEEFRYVQLYSRG